VFGPDLCELRVIAQLVKLPHRDGKSCLADQATIEVVAFLLQMTEDLPEQVVEDLLSSRHLYLVAGFGRSTRGGGRHGRKLAIAMMYR
jgi:hypothetical protein